MDEKVLTDEIKRCELEIEACRQAGKDFRLTARQKLGAIQGEVDWLVALQMAKESRSSLNDILLMAHP
jgi:hypothetical protein